MQKIELKQAELAILSALVRVEIERTAQERREEQRETAMMLPKTLSAPRSQTAALGYYTERLHILCALKAKLDRDEGGDGNDA